MYKFFHNYPTCPNCSAPIMEYTKVKLSDSGSFRCENCGLHFFNSFLQGKRRKKIFHGIELNKIEKTYLSFLNKNIPGKFLITWPWDDVKFTPILASNYLFKRPKNKVIIVDKFKKDEKNIFSHPSVDILFKRLYYIDKDDFNNNPIDESLITEDKIFESRKKFYCNVTLIEDNLRFYKKRFGENVTFKNNMRFEVDYEENKLKKFREDMINEIERKYSELAIYSVRNAHENKLPKIMNEYGIFRLTFTVGEGIEQDISLSDEFKKNYSNVLANISKIDKVSNKIKSAIIYDEFDLKNDFSDYNLLFLDDSIDSRKLLNFISRINADVTIFSRADLFFERSLIFNKGFEFINFVNSANHTVLLFSTFKDNRALYKIGDESSPLNEYGVIPHTWDFGEIIDNLAPKKEHLSLGSSNFNDIKSTKNIPVEYISVDELDSIEDTFSDILEFNNSNKVVKSFLRDLIRTPLHLKGYFRDKKVFGKHNLTFESLFATIYNRDEELGIKLDSIYNSVYKKNNLKYNPLFNSILSIVNDFKFSINDQIIFVVDFFETKGLKELMELNIDDERIIEKLDYSSWDKLNEYKFKKNKNYYIISTKTPYINFKLNNFDFKKIYFVGSNSVIDDLKIEMTKRLTDEGTKPIFVFDEDNKKMAPNLLIKSIDKIEHLPKVIKTYGGNLNSKLNYTSEVSQKWNVQIKSSGNSRNKYNVNLTSEDEAILVVSRNGLGMFLPLNNNIYIKNKNGGVEELTTSKDSFNSLINKEIVLDSEGFYTSFRLLFFNFMLESERNVPIFYHNFQWNDFKSLLIDAFEWLELLRKVFKNHYESKNFAVDDKYKFAQDISKLNLNAKDPEYIKKFWLCDPVYLETSEGNIPIYEKEHPRSGNDLVYLYQWLDNTFSDINLSMDDALRSYGASITLQRIRRLFLRKKESKLPYVLLSLYRDFEKILDRVLLNADSFEVSHANIVKLNDDIIPYKVINDYKQYLE